MPIGRLLQTIPQQHDVRHDASPTAGLGQVRQRVQRNLNAVRELQIRGAPRQSGARGLITQQFGRPRAGCRAAVKSAAVATPASTQRANALRLVLRDGHRDAGASAGDRLQQRGAAIGDDEPRVAHEIRQIALAAAN